MKRIHIIIGLTALVLAGTALAADFRGDAKVGYVYLDQEGNQAMNQPTFNLYEGGVLSLENFRYSWDNGLRLFGDFNNITMNNRNLALGVQKSGLGGVSLRHDKYRRVYSFDGERYTRREQTAGQVWVNPVDHVKLFGGYGLTRKAGQMVDLVDPAGSAGLNEVDYSQSYYNAGAEFTYNRSRLEVEYRGSSYGDDIDDLRDRDTRRLRATAVTPLPRYENLLLNGGFQNYRGRLVNRDDTLTANTAWLGARWFYGDGYTVRYSFVFDRARRTGDLTATDNLVNALYAGKTWRGKGGVQAGYRHRINDDVADEVTDNGYVLSGWINATPDLQLRAGFGSETSEVQEGTTLTGDQDRTRLWGQVRYRHSYGTIRLKGESRSTENDDIGTSADFFRLGSDLSVSLTKYGTVSASYAYSDGEYENVEGVFQLRQHVFNGDFLSVVYRKAQVGFGGTYVRSQRDLDVESFSVRMSGLYEFIPKNKIEVIYSAHNFDNFADTVGLYTEYYTANVVEVNLIHEF